jgi:hypothetical protein
MSKPLGQNLLYLNLTIPYCIHRLNTSKPQKCTFPFSFNRIVVALRLEKMRR